MNIITINKGKGKEDMKVRKIIASILTFMMIFMNIPTNVFAVDKEIINSDYAITYKDTKKDNSDKKNDEVVDKDDKKKEEVVNKDESTSNNQETVKTETKKVKTGDNSNSIFYLGLIGVSLLVIYCLVMKKFIQ